MRMYKFLLVEDANTDVQICMDTVSRMNEQATESFIEVVAMETFLSAQEELKKAYDGVIVDITLDEGHTGNEIIHQIINNYRIPVAVMTGTPDINLEDDSPICIYKKGETTYEEIINSLIKINKTGLFKVIGGKGIIESTMNKIFWKNLYGQIAIWENLQETGVDTEKILLRYAIAHIQEIIDDVVPNYVTEEMYIKPPLTESIRTGSIICSKKDGSYGVVLSPPCDLVMHDGEIKTDRILVCEIDDFKIANQQIIGQSGKGKAKKVLVKALTNNHTEYYHWLPQNALFTGGYVNFRKILTYSPTQLKDEFNTPELRIQEHFIKDLLRRFSSYYSGQGQPDFDFDKEAETAVEDLFEAVDEAAAAKASTENE